MKNARIIAVHLLNDFSGSPFVFSQALEALHEQGMDIELFTSTPSGEGFLNTVSAKRHNVFYRWSKSRWLTLVYFLYSQWLMFWRVITACERGDIIYINTILPFGAALAGKLRGCHVVYHIHEVSIRPVLLKKFLLLIVGITASHCIYVSAYVRNNTAVNCGGTVIYNALPIEFVRRAKASGKADEERFRVLMLCSMKVYKGIFSFLECARRLPDLHFDLVLNAKQFDIEKYFFKTKLPANISIYPAQADVHRFYESSSVVVNFSLPDQWVETFGMTALEAMNYGKPVIVPPIGGITELVENGISGFCIDARDVEELTYKISWLSSNRAAYRRISEACLLRAEWFTQNEFSQSIVQLFYQLRNESLIASTKMAKV
jgi:L-malate glycosyltransferase